MRDKKATVLEKSIQKLQKNRKKEEEIIARLKVASPSECGRLVDKIIKLKIKQK